MIHSEHLFHIIFEMKTSPARYDSSRGFSFLVGEDPWTSCGAVLGRSHFDFRGLDPRDGRSPPTRRDRWTLSSHLQGSLLLCVGGPRDWKKRLKPSQCEKQQGFSSSFMHLWSFQSFFFNLHKSSICPKFLWRRFRNSNLFPSRKPRRYHLKKPDFQQHLKHPEVKRSEKSQWKNGKFGVFSTGRGRSDFGRPCGLWRHRPCRVGTPSCCGCPGRVAPGASGADAGGRFFGVAATGQWQGGSKGRENFVEETRWLGD